METDAYVEIEDPNSDDYEPTQAEVEEYAKWLGADVSKDRDLFWIAQEALKAPIPTGWKLYQKKDGSGEPFYFNSKTGESLWDHPLDQHYKDMFEQEKKKKIMGGGNNNAGTRPSGAFGTKNNSTIMAKPLSGIGTNQRESMPPVSLGPLKGTDAKQLLFPSGHNNQNSYEAKNTGIRESNDLANQNRLEMERMKQDFERRLQEELRILRAKGDADKNQLQYKLDQELDEMKASHRRKMDDFKRSYQIEIENQERLQSQINVRKLDSETELKQIKERGIKQVVEAELENENQIKQLKQENDRIIEQEKRKFALILDDLKRQQDSEIKTITSKHKEKIEELNKNNNDELSKQERIDSTKESFGIEIEQLKKQHESGKNALALQNQEELSKMQRLHRETMESLSKTYELEVNQAKSMMSTRKPEANGTIDLLKEQYERKIKDLEEKNENIQRLYNQSVNSQNVQGSPDKKLMNEMKKTYEERISKLEKQLTDKNEKSSEEKQQLITDYSKKIQSLEKKIEQMKQNDLKNNQMDNDEKIESLEGEIEEMKLKHQKEINSMKKLQQKAVNDHQKEIERIKNQYEIEKEELVEEHLNELEETKEKYINEIESLKRNQKKADAQKPNLNARKSVDSLILSQFSEIIFSNNPIKSHFNNPRKTYLAISFSIGHNTGIKNTIMKSSHSTIIDLYPNPAISDQTFVMNQNMQRSRMMSAMNSQMSRMGEVYQPQFSRVNPDQYTEIDEKILSKMKKHKFKIQQITEQFGTSYDGLVSSLKQQLDDVNGVCNSYKKLISEQNKMMTQMVADFQQQASQMTRNFNNTILDIENSYRAAMAVYSNQNALPSPPLPRKLLIKSHRELRKPNRIEIISEDEEVSPVETETDKTIRNWKIESKKTKKSAKRVHNQFEQLKAIGGSD